MDLRILKNIYEGWTNYIFQSEAVKEMAEERAKICSSSGPNGQKCPHANPNFLFKNLKDGQLTEIEGLGCDKCRCLISAKVRYPLEKCPIGKWEKS